MSGGSPACLSAARAPGRSVVASQSTVPPVSSSQADLTASKLSNSGPLQRPRTWTWAPPRPCGAVLAAPADADVVAVAVAGGVAVEPEQPPTKAATSITRPAVRIRFSVSPGPPRKTANAPMAEGHGAFGAALVDRSPPDSDGTSRRGRPKGDHSDDQDAQERDQARAGGGHTDLLTSATRLTRRAGPDQPRESRGFASPGHPGFAFVGQPPGWDGVRRRHRLYGGPLPLCTFQPVPSEPRTLGAGPWVYPYR